MSVSVLKSAVVPASETQQRKDVAALLVDPKIKRQIALALPQHVTADRFARVALTELRRNPTLAQCEPASFLGAIMLASQLGLEPGGALGHAYLVPYRNRKTEKLEVQFILGYQGMIDLARRSGHIKSIEARAVYEGDEFHCKFGLESELIHKPDWENPNRTQADKLRFVYAVAHLKDGGVQFEVMSRREIEAARAQSKASSDGPWNTHFEQMARKTVIRRLFKYLPVSIEIARAVEVDETADRGESQRLEDEVINIDIAAAPKQIEAASEQGAAQ